MSHPNNLVVRSINISEKKGTLKKPVDSVIMDAEGIQGDAHRGPWHRQVSLLSVKSLEDFEKVAGRTIQFGEFAENITLEGFDFAQIGILDRFRGNEVDLEVTQIGKACHGDDCAIFREVGKCAMPKEGLFCRVIKGGTVRTGERFTYERKVFTALILTLSDRASKGHYKDKSGQKIADVLNPYLAGKFRRYNIDRQIIPDDPEELIALLKRVNASYDLIITTGGTGIGTKDITPDIVEPLLDKQIPGIMERVRMKYGQDNPNALLSRSIAGIAGETMIYTLPGSTKAVEEYLEIILPTLKHTYFMVHDLDVH